MLGRGPLVALLALAGVNGTTADRQPAADLQRPALRLRASPGAALPPVNVLFVAELVGGDEVEELYCPEIEWDFDNGRRSSQLEDCEPFTDASRIERRYLVRQSYTQPGDYRVILTSRRSDLVVAQAAATVHVAAPGSEDGGPYAAGRH
jgi:hypothetical protein